MTDWRKLVDRLQAVERDADEWREGLAAAEAEAAALRGELAEALKAGGVLKNGVAATAAHAPPPPVKRRKTMDYDRRHRILDLMKTRGGFLSVAEAARAEKASREIVGATLNQLCHEGKVRRVSRGRYALPDAGATTPAGAFT